MRQIEKFLVLLLLSLSISVVSGANIDISPDILFEGMPVIITFSDLQDDDWVDVGFQATYVPTETGYSGIYEALLSLPFNLSDVWFVSVDGNITDNHVNYFSETYDFSGMSEGPLFFDMGKNITIPGEQVSVSYILAGDKESGETEGTIILYPEFVPPRGVLNVTVWDGDEYVGKDIPYFQDLYAAYADVDSVMVKSGEKAKGNITLHNLEEGLSYCEATIVLDDPSVGVFDSEGIEFAEGFQGGYVWYANRVHLYAIANESMSGPIDEIPIASLTYEGLSPGSSLINLTVINATDFDGAPIPHVFEYPGTLTVTAPPQNDFTGTPTKGIIPFNVSFQYLPDDAPTSFNWTFGDGSPNATIRNPTHTYTTPGTYDVTLTVTGDDGSVTKQKTGYIEAKQVALWFMGNQTAGPAPLVVEFTGMTSAPHTNWQYYFGDGSSGAGPDITHVYTTPGTYTVKASADISGSKNSAIRYNYIRVT